MSQPHPGSMRLFLRLIVAALCTSMALTVLLGVIWIGVDPLWELAATATGLAALLMLLCVAWLVAALVIRAKRLRLLMIIAMTGTACGILLLGASLWCGLYGYWQASETTSRLGVTFLVPALAVIHNAGLSLLRTRRALTVVKVLTMLCAWVFAAAGLCIMWIEQWLFGASFFGFVMLLLTILVIGGLGSAVGTIIVPIVAVSRANKPQIPIESLEARLTIDMTCPKCGRRQSLPAGSAQCAACRARLFIEVEEPRCKCGYLLYRLESATCPECGREIDPALCWTAGE